MLRIFSISEWKTVCYKYLKMIYLLVIFSLPLMIDVIVTSVITLFHKCDIAWKIDHSFWGNKNMEENAWSKQFWQNSDNTIQMMHGSEWTLKYDEPEIQNVARWRSPSADIFNQRSSYFSVTQMTTLIDRFKLYLIKILTIRRISSKQKQRRIFLMFTM